jgi:hypothetical protein
MEVRIVACGIFQPELEQVLKQIREERSDDCIIDVTYVPPALHIDYDKLKDGITDALDHASEQKKVLLFGSMCHPELGEFTEKYHVVRPSPGNCVELILGKGRQKEIEKSAKVFYLTSGWLQNWEDIFRRGQGWDEIDGRMNFGFYDKILLLDTDVAEFSDEEILEFFEFTQVPIEIESVDLAVFKENVAKAIEEALNLKRGDIVKKEIEGVGVLAVA